MPLTAVSISNLRNLHNVELVLSDGLNLFYGSNGAGKTSILEAISFLGLGRSFKSRTHKNLIGSQQQSLTVFGMGAASNAHSSNFPFAIGVSRFKSSKLNQTQLNGSSVGNSSTLADLIPVQWIDSESFNLLVGSPSYRRAYLDWTMFHVKHNFRSLFFQYQQSLKQRNAVLRRGKIACGELRSWDELCGRYGKALHEFRTENLSDLLNDIRGLISEHSVFGNEVLDIEYQPGWNTENDLVEEFANSFERDLARGYTTIGPHKADLLFSIKGIPVAERYSRGQLKAAVYALYSAQIELVTKLTGKKVLCLLDDLPAELDEDNRISLVRWLEQLNIQCYVTGINKNELLKGWSPALINSAKMFHVKHGEVTESPIIGEIHDRQ